MIWTQAEAIELCRRVEEVCPAFGCHVALTGGLLYKDGLRKDCDLVFYRIRQWKEIDVVPMFGTLSFRIGLFVRDSKDVALPFVPRFVIKATFHHAKPVDCFFPEVASGEYPPDADPRHEVNDVF